MQLLSGCMRVYMHFGIFYDCEFAMSLFHLSSHEGCGTWVVGSRSGENVCILCCNCPELRANL